MAFWFRGFVVTALAALAGLGAPAGLFALTFNVNSTADIIDANLGDGLCVAVGGGCTLRAAVMQANVAGGVGATIVLPAGTYLLYIPVLGSDGDWEGDLNLTTPASGNPAIQIVGSGAATTIIDPDGLSRAFNVASGRTASISGVTIRNGFVSTGDGGAIRNAGVLVVSNSLLTLNSAFLGGAIRSTGTLAVSNSVLTGNDGEQGGAISGQGDVTLTATVLSSNVSNYEGGGVYLAAGTLTMVDSVLSGNSIILGNSGGGLFAYASAVVIDRTTISGNSAGYAGGGILALSGNLFVRNSTISGNHANGDGGGIHISGLAAAANIYNSSILFNEADADADVEGGTGGGIYNDAVTVNVRNTLIAGNYLAGQPDYDDCTGTIGSYGMSLFTSPASICTIFVGLGSTGYVNSLSMIGPLQANGGPTPTHALLAGSNAIDGTLPAYPCVNEASQPLLTDQRGVTRALGLRCDVGAFEFNEIFRNGFETGDTSAWIEI